jgi:hypothetical protein
VDDLLLRNGSIWVPTRDLHVRVLIIAHCSRSGHRGAETTAQIILKTFWWPSLRDDCREFVEKCLHCSVNKGKVVEQMHTSVRNQKIHYDYLYIKVKNPTYSYIVVLKDDLTNFIRLIP